MKVFFARSSRESLLFLPSTVFTCSDAVNFTRNLWIKAHIWVTPPASYELELVTLIKTKVNNLMKHFTNHHIKELKRWIYNNKQRKFSTIWIISMHFFLTKKKEREEVIITKKINTRCMVNLRHFLCVARRSAAFIVFIHKSQRKKKRKRNCEKEFNINSSA